MGFFGKESWAAVFQAFDREPDRDWAAEFRIAPLYTRDVLSGLDGDAGVPGPERVAAEPCVARAVGRGGVASMAGAIYR